MNKFLKMEDAVAVIDLAGSCVMFDTIGNYRACGVCYNNIANYHVKHQKYSLAI